MVKISERAVELMVARHKKDHGPSPGFSSFYDYMTRTRAHGYPGPTHCSSGDTLQALDEYQAEQKTLHAPIFIHQNE